MFEPLPPTSPTPTPHDSPSIYYRIALKGPNSLSPSLILYKSKVLAVLSITNHHHRVSVH